jgi:hypothetical protein
MKNKQDKKKKKKNNNNNNNNNKKKVTEETADGKRTKEEGIKWLEGIEEQRRGIQGERVRRKERGMRTIRMKMA